MIWDIKRNQPYEGDLQFFLTLTGKLVAFYKEKRSNSLVGPVTRWHKVKDVSNYQLRKEEAR
jgi:hypothetical protein